MFAKNPKAAGLIIALVALGAMAILAASASAFTPQLLNKKGGTGLRDLASAPTNVPDAGEFVNSTPVQVESDSGTIKCSEIEFGTIVKKNRESAVELTVPFAVAEAGDGAENDTGCTIGGVSMPTYFNTNNLGAVGKGTTTVASITISGAGTATVHNLSFSQNLPGVGFCTYSMDGKSGTVANGTEPFGEEGENGLTVTFNTKITATGTGCVAALGAENVLTGTFRLETPSTATEGWWLG